jgi:hypothetical protein
VPPTATPFFAADRSRILDASYAIPEQEYLRAARARFEEAKDVAVTATTASGYLDAYRAGGTDTHTPSMYFAASTGQTYVSFQDSLLSRISPTGQETVTDDSSGSLKVQVSVVGLYYVPQVPAVPTFLQAADTGCAPRTPHNQPCVKCYAIDHGRSAAVRSAGTLSSKPTTSRS